MARQRLDALDETRMVTVRMPSAWLECLDEVAEVLETTRAELIREAIRTALEGRLVTRAGKLRRAE
jgi:metal-responsive CopG/Arc/MetJ family transcriptional regulator